MAPSRGFPARSLDQWHLLAGSLHVHWISGTFSQVPCTFTGSVAPSRRFPARSLDQWHLLAGSLHVHWISGTFSQVPCTFTGSVAPSGGFPARSLDQWHLLAGSLHVHWISGWHLLAGSLHVHSRVPCMLHYAFHHTQSWHIDSSSSMAFISRISWSGLVELLTSRSSTRLSLDWS